MICIPVKLFSQNSQISPDQAEKGTREIEKHVVYAISVLELHLETIGHVLENSCFISSESTRFTVLCGVLRPSYGDRR